MTDAAPAPRKLQPLRRLLPFVRPYRRQVALALLFLLLAASATLALPYAVRLLVDQGLATPTSELGAKLVAIRQHFGLLFGVADYPRSIVDLKKSRERALAAFRSLPSRQAAGGEYE